MRLQIALHIKVFLKAIVLTTKPHFDVRASENILYQREA